MQGMSIRVSLRTAAIAFCAWSAAAAASGMAFADERPFTREDYDSYFEPGRFATWSPFYQSDGWMQVVVNRKATVSGRNILEQTTRSFDVAANYDIISDYAFYKIESQNTDLMMWDERRRAWVYDYTSKEFDTDTARVWESKDKEVELSDTDLDRGPLHQFYRDADKRAGRDASLFDRDFRNEVIGVWSWSCAWVNENGFDVECKAAHEKSDRVETYFYRKLDLIG
jgi:hypothetical protein